MPAPGIYVEVRIRAGLEELWSKTQDPALHERWDLRFSTIAYRTKDPEDPRGDAQPQLFDYETRIGFGLAVRGGGESLGERNSESERTSALRFWSDDPKSLIREGSGYWKYIAEEDGIRFFTWYDYEPRFGAVGRVFDRLCFRPLMGWATAWSFDRLRLWIEAEVLPEQTLRWTLVYTVCRLAIAMIWIWHGLVPKILFPQADEMHLLAAAGVSSGLLPVIGALEVGFGLAGVMFWRWRGYFAATAVAMALALGSVAVTSRDFLAHAFNPVTLNVAVIALAAAGHMASPGAAFAGRCHRRPVTGGI